MPEAAIVLDVRVGHGAFELAVDARLPATGTTVIFGPSGCGKSTLLRAIAGLEPACQGAISVAGEEWLSGRHRLPAHRRAVGMVFQDAALLPHLSVEKNLRYGWTRAGRPAGAMERWIDRLDLSAMLARAPRTLSGGERQRVALARALVTAPRLLLLDEPLSALDEARRKDVLPSLEAVRRDAGIPILYVTHSVEEVSRLADHLLLMEAGRILADGPALALLNRPDLPLALRDDAGVVIEAEVEERDSHGLLTMRSPAGRFHAHGPHSPGSRLRLRIQARDVSLALQRHEDSSVLNLLPATITDLTPLPEGQVQAALRVNGCRLLARLSHRSVETLSLGVGKDVWAQVKAVALLL
ncbi:molybdenum ABC transporter ATP-binding protein [Lysobacter pythonis]|uniref:Molybdenum ABC transporter ATP-binding protein n=1 Tax=Solilutibacter pythonis TaxID=2483112 RepID=A0A3M2I2E6_9GAMM|nr:molybdenum ABC transporter ATP-binding protein [Lysobacter pythonis]RMH93769.1 molybdenum ABC transporter ATP-binding protein [Lysobacter pythonis]